MGGARRRRWRWEDEGGRHGCRLSDICRDENVNKGRRGEEKRERILWYFSCLLCLFVCTSSSSSSSFFLLRLWLLLLDTLR